MAESIYTNFAKSTLSGAIDATQTTLSVVAPALGAFPSPGAGQQFVCTLRNNGASYLNEREIIYVGSRSTNDFSSITRDAEGTSGPVGGWPAGTDIFVDISATIINALVHGTDYDANTILAATSDDTPVTLTVTEQTIVGRLTGGDIAAIDIGISDNNMVQIDSASVADGEYMRATANGVESRTPTELLSEFATLDATFNSVTTPAAANPGLLARDSGAPGADKTVGSLLWDFLSGGDGAENSGSYWSVFIGGVSTVFAEIDGVNERIEFKKPVLLEAGSVNPVSTKTDDYQILTTDSGFSLRMNHADSKTFTLPSVGATEDGYYMLLYKIGAGNMVIAGSDSDTVGSLSDTSITCTSAHKMYRVEYCHATTKWMLSTIGDWS